MPADSSADLPGDRASRPRRPASAPRFAIERELGQGATARVLLARLLEPCADVPAGAWVALKRLRPELAADPLALAAFENEARAGRALKHPGLAATLAAGADAEGPYQVQPYVPGQTLHEVLERSGPLPEPLLRAVVSQVAGGLAALHASGWAHGDVKPENMRLDEHGRAVLLDLGFAVELERADDPRPPPQAGSLPYLAPERARGAPASSAGDVFALGVVLYELATGAHPFLDAEDALTQSAGRARSSSGRLLKRSLSTPGADRTLAAMATARFIPPSRLVPQLSPLLDALGALMLQREPERRPSAESVAERLREGEAGLWWSTYKDVDSSARRGVMGESENAHLTPMVGRERELEDLLSDWRELGAAFATTATVPAGEPGPVGELRPAGEPGSIGEPAAVRRGRAVWIRGPEGSGKSRLVSAFALRARRVEPAPLYLYGRCSSLELQRPCAPVLRLLQRWLRLPPGSVPQARERALIGRLVPPATARALSLALETDLEQEAATAVPVALVAWIEALARRGPLIVYLDDVNFADEGTLFVLSSLCDRLEQTPLLLALGERAHEPAAHAQAFERLRAKLLALPVARAVDLPPLDLDAVQRLVEQVFHHSAPLQRISEILWSRSRGNPGLLSEILRHLIDAGQAHPHSAQEPGLVLSIAPERMPLPRSLRTLIQGRFRKLSTDERSWLRRMAVAGGRIEREFLQRLHPRSAAPELDQVLTRLVALGWIVPAGDRFRFARPALREAVYRSIPEAQRVRLHARAARALRPAASAAGAPGRMTLDDAFQRAFHLRAAGEHAELLRVLDPLMSVLLRRGQPARVHTLAQWGLEGLDALPPSRARDRQRIRFLEAAADAADRRGDREVQRVWLDRLSDLDLQADLHAAELARVYLLHGRFAAGTGQYGLARGMLRNAVELSERANEPELSSEALRRLAAVQIHVGALEEAQELVTRARESAVHGPQEALAWLQQGLIHLLRDDLEEALRSVDRAMRLLRRASGWTLPGVFAAAHMLRGRVYRLAGRPRRAIGALQHAVRLAQRAGERRLEMEATARLGGLLVDVDRPREAEARLREALLIADEIEDRRGKTLANLWLGVLLWEQGDPDGTRLIEAASRLAGETGLMRAEALSLAILARTQLAADHAARALEDSARATDLLASNGAELADRIVILGTRARALHAAGRTEEADELVRDLRRRLRRENERITNPVMRRRHRLASTRLLAAVLRSDGRLYPRVKLGDAER